ncbi:MAG: ABC transporter permease subunit [Actinobacteria bacterium]|nr:ABC transporter permease subunit [Actinomycetota bacterium]
MATKSAAKGDLKAGREPATDQEQKALLKKRADRRSRWIWRLAGYVFFIGIWQFSSTYLVEDFILPPPLTILETMQEIVTSGLLVTHFGATLEKIAIGFSLAFIIGAFIGILMGMNRWWEAFFSDWVLILMTTPGLIFVLVSTMVFGLSYIGPIVAVVITGFPYVAVNLVEGVKAAPKDLTDMARSYNVSRARLIRHVIIPFLAPFIFTAIRYGFSIAWKVATLTEVIGGNEGIGFMMRREFQSFSMAGFLSWALLFFAFALFLERIVLQRQIDRFFRWRPEVTS